MSWSSFPPSRIIPLGNYRYDSLTSRYFSASWARRKRYRASRDMCGAAISTARQPVCLSPRRKTEESRDVQHLYSLGSAYAGPGCRGFWPEGAGRLVSASLHERSATATPVDSVVHVPAEIRQMMAQVARANGRSERDLWTEAADAWLASHTNDDDPVPPAPSAALALPAASRSWDMIDDLLSALRRPVGGSGTRGEERAA